MDKVLKSILGVTIVVAIAMFAMSSNPAQGRRGKIPQGPVVKRLSTYRGDSFAGFAEFRVQDIEFDDLGAIKLTGVEPYDMLINVTYITGVYRYEDAKKTDYSTLMFCSYMKEPILVRQPYNDVVKSIEKAMDEYCK